MNATAMIQETLTARIADLVRTADRLSAEYWDRMGYSGPPTHRADVMSSKWVRVVTIETRGDGSQKIGSVYAFVALTDYETKGLGRVNAGGIHKPASYDRPAKHERGNVFRDDYAGCLTPYGVASLR